MAGVTRTVIVRTVKLPRKVFKVFVELEGTYCNMVEQLTLHAVRNSIRSFTKLKGLKYREMRNLYPQLPSHYVHTACQEASTRSKSLLRLKRLGLAERKYPELRRTNCNLLKALRGDGSYAPSPVGQNLLDVRLVPLASNAIHDLLGIKKSLWARWNSLGATMNLYKITGMNT